MSKQSAAQKLAAELASLAKAATPGPWVIDGDYVNEHGYVLYSYIASGRKTGGRIANTFANCLVKTDEQCQANAAFIAGANPKAVLMLTAEIERLKIDEQEATDLCDRLAALLRGVALAVKGPAKQLSSHSFHDLPPCVKTVVDDFSALKAECEGLRARTVIDKEAARWRMRELLPGVPGDLIDYALSVVIHEAKT
ncbi:hypothetical protein QN366_01385 [Pseudomonas sp. CCC3.2]|uniref:hypothetical protein n=1 Tax=unclassified Pseudomonas TaxID=196821 RepID=UPI002AB54837|nr:MULTISPECIES: hypothetical protein [unclassified Pseudomonas]MDY7560173.1 hypothetical protein [Pseudomonas sp. AB6]MEB0178722.1 hypothetical protein [Pseudomonas sp. CCC3.2]MEB0211360.1 hypothetical protein [Pseudomonas sp. AB6]